MTTTTQALTLTLARDALARAKQFIANGREFGYIRMPDADTPDPAHETPGKVDEALAAIDAHLASDDDTRPAEPPAADVGEPLTFTLEEVPRTNHREGNYWRIRWDGGSSRPASAPERELWKRLQAARAQLAREPLTEVQRRQSWARHRRASSEPECDFMAGIDAAERAHGITSPATPEGEKR